jgi:KEOPS complex subunit Cgi121
MIRIIGAKGQINNAKGFLKKILEYSRNFNITIQVVDADLVYGSNHLYSAAEHAIRAMQRKTNSTHSLGIEIMLYASGDRQIKNAIKKMGISEKSTSFAFVVVDKIKDLEGAKGSISNKEIQRLLDSLGLSRDDSVLEGNREVLKRFGITIEELSTVNPNRYEKLILEKVAMVDILK